MFEEAEKLFAAVLDFDEAKKIGTQDWKDSLMKVGVQAFHRMYYDGGWFNHEVIKEHIRAYPSGALVCLLKELVIAKSQVDGYKEETLQRMYGF